MKSKALCKCEHYKQSRLAYSSSSEGCFQNISVSRMFRIVFQADPVILGFHQTHCNSNHLALKRNTLVELKSISVSSYCKSYAVN